MGETVTISIASTSIEANQGVDVKQGSVTGKLKTKLNGQTKLIIINVESGKGIGFKTNAPITVGTTTIPASTLISATVANVYDLSTQREVSEDPLVHGICESKLGINCNSKSDPPCVVDTLTQECKARTHLFNNVKDSSGCSC